MLDVKTRNKIMQSLGQAVDSVVREHYPGLSQEPAITSRIGQNIEACLNGRHIGDYVIRIITQDIPDRGSRSLEKITGTDLFISVSLEGSHGFDKGFLVQTKFDRGLNRTELQGQCRRMQRISKSSYVWVYTREGVSVVSAEEVMRMQGNSLEGLQSRSVAGFFGRVLDCNAGSKKLGIPPVAGRRAILTRRLQELRAIESIDVNIKKM